MHPPLFFKHAFEYIKHKIPASFIIIFTLSFTLTFVPFSSLFSIITFRPRTSDSFCTIDNPSPTPSWRDLSACRNGCRIFSLCSSQIPIPVSAILHDVSVSITEIFHHSGVYLYALSRIFERTLSAAHW